MNSKLANPKLSNSKLPKIGIYAGSGTSHSWLWFVNLFETAGLYHLFFLNEQDVRQGHLNRLDVLVISGGDTFAVAAALGRSGALAIERFVGDKGTYIGSCAGAYLPMKSSKKPLDLFNFVDVKITNLSKILPEMKIQTCKFSTAYGCDFIFHPVRESVRLRRINAGNQKSWQKSRQKDRSGIGREFDAPLYGGPGMVPQNPSWTLAEYAGFTNKTLFLTDHEIATKTLVGHGAVLRVPYKRGCFYLLGPHLEHPGYPKANQFIVDAVVVETRSADNNGSLSYCPSDERDEDPWQTVTGKKAKALLLPVRRELSNSRITAGSLEFLPVQWLIGRKVYEPQKIRVFLESLWQRLKRLEKEKMLKVSPEHYETIVQTATGLTRDLRRMKRRVDRKEKSLNTAVTVFKQLHTLSISFFEFYFKTMFTNRREECIAEKKNKENV